MGVGDVSLPLCHAVIRALHEAVDDQTKASTFHGYMPEVGAPFLRKAIAGYYAGMGANVAANEIFISSGACDDLGDILELFDQDNTVMVIEPAYPEYVDTNILGGRKSSIWHQEKITDSCRNRMKVFRQISSTFALPTIRPVQYLTDFSCRHGSTLQTRTVR